jgi:hypothetical protein
MRVFHERHDGFHMVRVWEQIKCSETRRVISVFPRKRDVSRQGNRVARDVDDLSGGDSTECRHDFATRSRSWRIENNRPRCESRALSRSRSLIESAQPFLNRSSLGKRPNPLAEIFTSVFGCSIVRFNAGDAGRRSTEVSERHGEQPDTAIEVEIEGGCVEKVRVDCRANFGGQGGCCFAMDLPETVIVDSEFAIPDAFANDRRFLFADNESRIAD